MRLLQCKKNRPGKECSMWKLDKKRPEGWCIARGGGCQKVVGACEKCRFVDGEYCDVFSYPSAHWFTGWKCSMYEDPEAVQQAIEQEKKLNPLKASKRGMKGGKK